MLADDKPSAESEPLAYGQVPDERSNAALNESEVLRSEARCAQAAIGRKLQELKSAAMNAADPQALTDAHPWLTVGAAAAAGFAAAGLVMPRRGERATDRMERLFERLQAAASNESAPKPASISPLSPVMSTLFDLARTAATTFLLNAAQRAGDPGAPQSPVSASPNVGSPADAAPDAAAPRPATADASSVP